MSVRTPLPRKLVELCGVRVEVRSTSQEFSSYLDKHFPSPCNNAKRPESRAVNPVSASATLRSPMAARSSSGTATSKAKLPPEETGQDTAITALVRWTEGPRPSFDPGKIFPDWKPEDQLDRYVYATPNGLLWLRVDDVPQIAIASRHEEGRRKLELRYHFSLGAGPLVEPLKRFIRWRWLPAKRRHRFSTIVYYAVYYPVWWHLECNGAAYPLHAGAVAMDGKAILLAGLPGSGKSTVTALLLQIPQAALLSDNIVVHNGTHVWGCYEPMLLSGARSRTTDLSSTGEHHAFDRRGYHAPHLECGFPPLALVILCRGDRTELKPITSAHCLRMLLAIDEAAKEVRRYHVFTAIFSIAERRGLDCQLERERKLKELLDFLPCFQLRVREGAPAEAVDELFKLSGGTVRAAR